MEENENAPVIPEEGQDQGKAAAGTPAGEEGIGDGENFIDPKRLNPNDFSPENRAIYREMQKEFQRKMTEIKQRKQDLQLVDQFRSNPVAVMNQLADQYGYSLSAKSGKNDNDKKKPVKGEDSPFSPSTWDEVRDWVAQSVIAEIKSMMDSKMSPVLQSLGVLSNSHLETQLDRIDPRWRDYEDEIASNLQQFPALATQPEKLYGMSSFGGRRMMDEENRRLRKGENQKQSSRISGAGSGSGASGESPKKITNFQDAVDFALDNLRKKGINY